MIRAAFDTSTSMASFALERDGEVIVNVSRECRRGASKLLPWILSLIREQGIRPADIDAWYAGIGPGSFTGLRVGLAFVKGCCENGAAYGGINSGYGYLGAALKAHPECEKITVIHDGRKRELICNRFEKTDGAWIEKGTEVVAVADLDEPDSVLVTVMDQEAFTAEDAVRTVFLEGPDAACFLNSPVNLPEDPAERDSSCEPIYVRPAVFVPPLAQRPAK